MKSDDEVVDGFRLWRYLPQDYSSAAEGSAADIVRILLLLCIQRLEVGLDRQGYDSWWVIGQVLLLCSGVHVEQAHVEVYA